MRTEQIRQDPRVQAAPAAEAPGWHSGASGTYYVDPDGSRHTGWWAYARPDGYVVRGKWTDPSTGYVYLANNDGKLEDPGWVVTGEYDGGLQRYWIDAKTHSAIPGYSSAGWPHVTLREGYVLRGETTFNGVRYSADNDGRVTGAAKDNGITYTRYSFTLLSMAEKEHAQDRSHSVEECAALLDPGKYSQGDSEFYQFAALNGASHYCSAAQLNAFIAPYHSEGDLAVVWPDLHRRRSGKRHQCGIPAGACHLGERVGHIPARERVCVRWQDGDKRKDVCGGDVLQLLRHWRLRFQPSFGRAFHGGAAWVELRERRNFWRRVLAFQVVYQLFHVQAGHALRDALGCERRRKGRYALASVRDGHGLGNGHRGRYGDDLQVHGGHARLHLRLAVVQVASISSRQLTAGLLYRRKGCVDCLNCLAPGVICPDELAELS